MNSKDSRNLPQSDFLHFFTSFHCYTFKPFLFLRNQKQIAALKFAGDMLNIRKMMNLNLEFLIYIAQLIF